MVLEVLMCSYSQWFLRLAMGLYMEHFWLWFYCLVCILWTMTLLICLVGLVQDFQGKKPRLNYLFWSASRISCSVLSSWSSIFETILLASLALKPSDWSASMACLELGFEFCFISIELAKLPTRSSLLRRSCSSTMSLRAVFLPIPGVFASKSASSVEMHSTREWTLMFESIARATLGPTPLTLINSLKTFFSSLVMKPNRVCASSLMLRWWIIEHLLTSYLIHRWLTLGRVLRTQFLELQAELQAGSC